MVWQLADAKNRFSEVVNRALTEGPQHVERRGEPVVVVLSEEDYNRLAGNDESLVEFLLNGPDLGDLDITRDESPMRDLEL